MKEFIERLIKQHITVLNTLTKEYVKYGGDVSTLGLPACPDPRQIRNNKGECVDDPGIGK